jgi:hypothetical protein
MAKVFTISKNDSPETIQKKLKEWNEEMMKNTKSFDAKKFTGKIKSFGDGLDYQKKLRDEWS